MVWYLYSHLSHQPSNNSLRPVSSQSSTYNLIWIREVIEWKTIRGHYGYLVMVYGLTNGADIFQTFMKEI